MGKVLILCEEDKQWNSPIPKQIVPVYGEQLLFRAVRQIRKRMNNFPHVISNQKCLRNYSTNYVIPSDHKYQSTILRSIFPIWGNDWTMILLGDVLYSETLMDLIYSQREKFHYHFYGTSQDIFALSFTDNNAIKDALVGVNTHVLFEGGRGTLMDLYYRLMEKPLPKAGEGYKGEEDDLHYTYIVDESVRFDSYKDYKEWIRHAR
jgi:hypothetical protein